MFKKLFKTEYYQDEPPVIVQIAIGLLIVGSIFAMSFLLEILFMV